MTDKLLLLSVQHQYAVKIFDGTKIVELRRTRPRIVGGDLAIIYVSTPINAIVGMLEIEKIIEASPSLIWPSICRQAGISKQTFDDYYQGANKAFALYLSHARLLPRPIHLNYLRRLWQNFRPPQSFGYLSYQDFTSIQMVSNQLRRRELLSMMP
jgi:predicted transcriptional regulator